MEFRVAAYQMPVLNDITENVRRITTAIDGVAEENAEILLTPEGSLSGYTHAFDRGAVEKGLDEVIGRARDRHVGLALGTCFVEKDDQCYNQIRFYHPDGEYAGFHSKILRCESVRRKGEGEMKHYATTELCVFPWKEGVIIGGLICNDLWANPEGTPIPDPHLSQKLSEMGATVILHAVNGSRDDSEWGAVGRSYHEANLRMRARAGNIWIVTVDNAHPVELTCSAPSGVINPAGEFVYRANPKGEELFVYSIITG